MNHSRRVPELRIHALTPAEIAIARLLVLGLTQSTIAAHRRRSPTTVRLQIRMLKMKLQVESHAALLETLRELIREHAAADAKSTR